MRLTKPVKIEKRVYRLDNPHRWIVNIAKRGGSLHPRDHPHSIPVEVNQSNGRILYVKIGDMELSHLDLTALGLVLKSGGYRLEPEKAPTIKKEKFKTPEELLKNVVSHGGRVFNPLTYWQSFNREANERVLNEVLLHAAEHPDEELYEVTYDGLVNVVDLTYIFTLPLKAEFKTGSAEWLEELDVDDVGKRLATLKEADRQ